jgi:photosystem II stability/assembly factor-like uncharacterized protein
MRQFLNVLRRPALCAGFGFVLIGVAGPDLAVAQTTIKSPPYVWKNVKVGGGGFIPGIVFSRVEKGLAYLRSDMGGAYRWDDSAKTWVPMHDALGESSYFGTESIAPDPVDANVVYIAAGMYRTDPAAILRSRDKGKTWDVFPVPFRMGGNEDGRGLGERLAVDPNDTGILYFGSRHDGLQRSADHGETWQKVDTFPIKGRGLVGWDKPANAGISFVVFDPKSGVRGSATRTLLVGSADPGEQHLFRSDDAGRTWKPVAGQPKKELLPAQAQVDDAGLVTLTYANNVGPNGVTDGAVMTYDVKTGDWNDITPDKRPGRPQGGYMGLSLDRQHPGALAVATMNRWGPIDTVWRTADGGKTWRDIVEKSERDVAATPFLLWGQPKAKLGWWMAALAIDPFDSDHAAYATGATIYATKDFSNVSKNELTRWHPWVEGIEQTAIITVMSPSDGAPLLSGFGDIGGFVHDDLDVSPPQGMYENPQFGNTNTLDYAGRQPNVIVRSGRPNEKQANLGYSEDGGRSWKPLVVPEEPQKQQGGGGRRERASNPAIVVSADGKTFMVMTRTPKLTRDRGQTWIDVRGLAEGDRPVSDRTDPATFYAIDFNTGKVCTSTDGGATFTAGAVQGLPADIKKDAPTSHEAAWPLHATLGKKGDLWFVSRHGLFHSADGGKTFEKTDETLKVDAISFGKEPPGKTYPAVFAIGTRGNVKAIWRSDDVARSWVRVNDDQHQYGTRFRCLAGDPRVFGRVYVGTDGRGIVYGEPAPAEARVAR